MAHRWIVAGVVVLVCAVAGAGVALLTRDDGEPSAATTTTSTTTTTTTTTTTAPPVTEVPESTTTTAPPLAPLPDPCGAEGPTIRAAVDAAVEGAATAADVEVCRIAAVDESWAMVLLVARPGSSFERRTVLLQGGGGAWSVVASGGPGTGCGEAPQQVLVDLGILCTSTGGGL